MGMRKNYVLDANVLLHDPSSVTQFADNTVIIPIEVIQEIDQFKREMSDRGQNARRVSRLLDALRGGAPGGLAGGVPVAGGGVLKVSCNEADKGGPHRGETVDDSILRIAKAIQREQPEVPVVIVTKDINLRIRADAMGLRAEDYESDRVGLTDLYTGQIEVTVSGEAMERFRRDGRIALPEGLSAYANEYVLLRLAEGQKRTALGRVDAACQHIQALLGGARDVCGVRPRNQQQYYALDALVDGQVRVATIMGKAGTGKTLLAVAGGLHNVLELKRYKALLVCRPTLPVGKDLGYLPGGVEQKLYPWMQPVFDTLEFLFDSAGGIAGQKSWRQLWEGGTIDVQPLSYIRGRNIAHQFVVVDEAQNLTPLEVKTVITRLGEGSKVALTGDPWQIDNPYVDSGSNGFNYLVNRFRAEPVAAHVQLVKGERSELAELAANLL
jgi:PhoH-like ATPase